jgi:hypothetical protein
MNSNNPAAMRPDSAAGYLSLSTQRLAKMRLYGGGPAFIKAGRSILYRREDLDSWLASLSRLSTSDSGGKAIAAA